MPKDSRDKKKKNRVPPKFWNKKDCQPPRFRNDAKKANEKQAWKHQSGNNGDDLTQHQLAMSDQYKGWNLYFSDYREFMSYLPLVQLLKHYLHSNADLWNWTEVAEKHCFKVDYPSFVEDEQLKRGWNTPLEKPDVVFSCLSLAMYSLVTEKIHEQILILYQKEKELEGDEAVKEPDFPEIPQIHARISNFGPITPLKNLKANCYGECLILVMPSIARAVSSCGQEQAVSQPDGKLTYPIQCTSVDCQSRGFSVLRNSPLTVTADWQSLHIQEVAQEDTQEGGRVPRTVDCQLTHDLVDCCMPGDLVTITGIVKVNNDQVPVRKSHDKCLFLLYIQVNSISDGKSSIGSANMDFTLQDLYDIKEVQSHPHVFQLLVSSLCPAIYGHEIVKAGLLLGLFGAPAKYLNDRNQLPIRGSPHVLLVGDPGLGKSQMLQACANIAPRGVYVCGNTTSVSGLTVTLGRDGPGGDYTLEAGALVLADHGCCCIDEFDKMKTQHAALLETMEQQTVSIAKAGVVCCLPAHATVLAAANPVGGHYNTAKTVSENLKISGALLSRFDLVFVLLDQPDEDLDSRLSEHVMSMLGSSRCASSTSSSEVPLHHLQSGASLLRKDSHLVGKLKSSRQLEDNPLPHVLLRKYVAYAQKYVFPKLSSEAALLLQEFYLELRHRHRLSGGVPITTRQLRSLIRLSEARARVELRENVTAQDCLDVIDIVKYSLIDTFCNESGMLDFTRSQNGSGMSSRKKAKQFISALKAHAERFTKSVFDLKELKEIAAIAKITVVDFYAFVDSLNTQGYLLKKGSNRFQLQVVDF